MYIVCVHLVKWILKPIKTHLKVNRAYCLVSSFGLVLVWDEKMVNECTERIPLLYFHQSMF